MHTFLMRLRNSVAAPSRPGDVITFADSNLLAMKRTWAVLLVAALVAILLPFNVLPAHAAVAGTASVANPAAGVFRGSTLNSFNFTVVNNSTTGGERIDWIRVQPGAGALTATDCSTTNTNWTATLASGQCTYSTTVNGSKISNGGASLSNFIAVASAGAGSTDDTSTWSVLISVNAGAATTAATVTGGQTLNTTVKVFEVLDAVVADASSTIDAACPSANKTAPEDSFKVIVVCGRNHGNAALIPTSGGSSLSGTFLQSSGTFASGPVAASSPASRVLANYTSAQVTTTAASGLGLTSVIGLSGSTSPATALTGYTAATDSTAPDTSITGGTADGATITTLDTASYTFTSTETGSSFQCSMSTGGDSFSSCTSPKEYSSLVPGSYTFKVRATDPAGNTDASPATRSLTVTVADSTPPTVQSINRTDANPTGAGSVQFTVTFSEGVTGVDTGDFALSTSGVSGASITSVSADAGSTRTVTVSTGSGDGTLGLNLVDDDSIADEASNQLGGTGAGNGNFTGQIYTVDKSSPTVSSIDRADGDPTNASSVEFTVTFSEAVTGVGTGDFALAGTGTSGASITSVSADSGTTRTVTVATGADGTLGLNLVDDDSIVDAASNKLGGTGVGNDNFTGQTYSVDKTAPSTSAISGPAPTNASSIDYTVAFSEVVTPVVIGDFALTTGGSVAGASVTNVVQGIGNTWVVTVSTGTGSGTIRLDVNDGNGTILDAAGNVLSPSTFTTGDVVTIDKTAPSVSSINRAGSSPSSAAGVDFTVTFNEAVTGVTAADFSVADSTTTGASITDVDGSGDTWTVSVDTGTGNGIIDLALIDDDTIVDGVGNALGGTGNGNGNFTTGQTYVIDKSAPSLLSINRKSGETNPTNANSVIYTATFSESVGPVDAADFTLTATGDAAGTVASVSGSGTTYDVTVNSVTGDGTLRLDLADGDFTIEDGAGNSLDPESQNGNQVFTIDNTAPAVTSITRQSPAGATTNADSVTFQVQFSETVTGVDGSDFALTGAATGTVGTVTAVDGDTYNVAVTSVAGNGTLGLDLNASGTGIQDSVTNAIATGFTGGETYTIDNTAPSVTSINRPAPASEVTNAASVQFIVDFTDSVAAVAATDFDLVTGPSISGASITSITSGPAATFTVTVNTGSGDGLIRLDFDDDDATVTDAVGNAVSPSTHTGDQSYTMDRADPVVVSIDRGNPAAAETNNDSVEFTATFSKSVTGVDSTDFVLTTTGVSGASVTGVTGSGATYTVTVDTGTGEGTVRLDVDDDDTIVDSSSNELGGDFTTGQTYTIDRTAPVISLDTPADASSVATLTPTFSGVADTLGLATVTIRIYEGASASGSPVQTLTTSRDAGTGAYSVDSAALTNNTTYTARASQLDLASNTGASSANTFTIDVSVPDTTPPVTSIDSGPSGTISSDSATFTFSANEPATFQCELEKDGSTLEAFTACDSGSKAYNSLGDGAYIFSVVATDTAGNPDLTPETQSFTVDSSASVGQVPTANADSIATFEGVATAITLTGSHPQGDPLTFEITSLPSDGTLHNGSATSDPEITAADLPATVGSSNQVTYAPDSGLVGSDSFDFIATDGTNDSTSATISIEVVRFAPQPPSPPVRLTTTPQSPANDNNPRISGLAAHGNIRLYTDASCSGDPVATGSTNEFMEQGLAVTVPDDSTTTFYATVTSASSGLTSSCSFEGVRYVEDSTAPGPSIPRLVSSSDTGVSDSDNLTNDTRAVFTGITEPGAMVLVMIDGFPKLNVRADAVTGVYRFSAPDFDDGEHRVRVRPTDAAGNAGVFADNARVRIDTRAARLSPEWNAKFISPNGDGRRDELKVSASLSEPVVWSLEVMPGVREFDDGSGAQADDAVYSTTGFSKRSMQAAWEGLTSDGTPADEALYNWELGVMDKAGNMSEPVVKRVSVDRTAPVVQGLEIGPNPFNPKRDHRARVRFELTEGGRATVRIRRLGKRDRVLNVSVNLSTAGTVGITWDGKDEMGRPVAPGRYMVIIKAVDRAKNLIWNRSGRIRVK